MAHLISSRVSSSCDEKRLVSKKVEHEARRKRKGERTNSKLVNRVHIDVDSDVGVHSSPSFLDDLGDLRKFKKGEAKLDQKRATREETRETRRDSRPSSRSSRAFP